MVCGRLPFGDDNQIKKMTSRELHFSRPISHGELQADYIDWCHRKLIVNCNCYTFLPIECRHFLKAVLNLNVEERFDSAQIQISGWAGHQPINRPRGFVPQKYVIENCLPQLLHTARPSAPISNDASGCSMILTSPYPVMQPVGGGAHITHPLPPSHVVTMHMHQPQVETVHYPDHTVRQTSTPPVSTPPSPPQMIQGIGPQLHSHGQTGGHSYSTPVRRPFVAKIGAAGRRIADAVKQVGHHGKGHSTSRHSSAGSSKSTVS